MDQFAISSYVIGEMVRYHRDIHPEKKYPDTDSVEFQMYLQDTANIVMLYLQGSKTLDGSCSDLQCSIAMEARKLFGEYKRKNPNGMFDPVSHKNIDVYIEVKDVEGSIFRIHSKFRDAPHVLLGLELNPSIAEFEVRTKIFDQSICPQDFKIESTPKWKLY